MDSSNITPNSQAYGILDLAFVKDFRQTLQMFNNLRDCSLPQGTGRSRFSNAELEEFRNNPKQRHIHRSLPDPPRSWKVYRSNFTPNLSQLIDHLVLQSGHTIFATNSASRDGLLMLMDVDNKFGSADADGAARYIVQTFLGGHGIIEPSTGGLGRHVYFKVRGGPTGARVHQVCQDLAQVVRDDPALRAAGVTFDKVFYGQPTLWTRTPHGQWRVQKRGDLLRLPYVSDFDLRPFRELEPIHLDFFDYQVSRSRPVATLNNEEDIGVTEVEVPVRKVKPLLRDPSAMRSIRSLQDGPPNTEHPEGNVRRASCWSYLMRLTEGKCSPADCLAYYHQHYAHTGTSNADTRRRLRDFHSLDRRLGPKYQQGGAGFGFRKGQYDEIVAALVPESALRWDPPGRRDRLTHERLSDFISIKIQDAFFKKSDPLFAGRASRDATIANTRVLQAKGLINWTCNSHLYKRLLEIAVRYELLEKYAPAEPPQINKLTGEVAKGRGALIGPGRALGSAREAFIARLHGAAA